MSYLLQVGLCGQEVTAEVMVGHFRAFSIETWWLLCAVPQITYPGGCQLPCREDS